jgi:hypothetical protein
MTSPSEPEVDMLNRGAGVPGPGGPGACPGADGDTAAAEFDPAVFSADPHDPWPEPARPWLRAEYLLCHGRRPMRGRDDPLTREAWRFRRGLARCRGAAGRGRLARRFPALAEAYAAYAAADPLRRAELEARLLAGEDDATIAAKTGLSAPGVATYHDVFFEVRPRLGAHVYVLDVVLGGRACYAPGPADHGLLLKLFGYHMGGPYVDVLLEYFREPPPVVPESLDGLDEASLRRLLGKLRTKLLLLATTTPAEALAPEEWLRLQGAMGAAPEPPQAGADGGASALAALRAAVEAAATLAEAAARGGPRAA